MTTSTLGFIGIGSMGKPMAQCLAKSGYRLLVHDANTEAAAAIADTARIVAVDSCAEVAARARVIITMLPTSAIVEQALLGAGGVFEQVQPGAFIIDMSSGVPATTRMLAAKAREKGVDLVDAPVSGGVQRAVTGELSIMYGGSQETFDTLRAILQTMGSSVVRTGEVGTAHAMKALNNLVSAGGFLIGIEALAIGKKFGLAPEMMVDILNASTGMNNSTQKKFKQFVLSGKYNAGFGLDLMVKDLGIALSMDDEQTAEFSRTCLTLWSAAADKLGRGADHTELAKYVIQRAGVTLP